jgi:hypothetical protein
LLLACLLQSGCVPLEHLLHKEEAPPTGKVCQIVTTWQKEVLFAPDPANNGVPRPGIAGRLYLFGPEIDFPLVGDGSLIVDLFMLDPPQSAGSETKPEYRLAEQWRLDPVTLRKLLRRDAIGWGYTLFLPWGSYKPQISQVSLKVRYDPAHGTPLYTESGSLTLTRSKGR